MSGPTHCRHGFMSSRRRRKCRGFAFPPDGPARDTPRVASPGSFGFDPSASPLPSLGMGFQKPMRFAPGSSYPDAYLTGGLPDFAPAPRHPLQDALDQIIGIYAGFGGSGGGSFSPTGRERDIQQVSLTDRPSETKEEREKRIFKVPIPRPDIPMPQPFPPPFHIPLPIIPVPKPPRPPEAPPPAPGNRIALRPT